VSAPGALSRVPSSSMRRALAIRAASSASTICAVAFCIDSGTSEGKERRSGCFLKQITVLLTYADRDMLTAEVLYFHRETRWK
jgi:hypothetical protein